MYHIAILASGSGSNALQIIKYFKDSAQARVNLIISNNPEAGVENHARAHGIDYVFYERKLWRENPEIIIDTLKSRNIEVVVLAGFLQLIPKILIAEFPNRILNIHPALLPNFGGKGMYGHHVHRAVKDAGSTESGITIHVVNENYDEGEIFFQARVQLDAEDSAAVIQKKVLEVEHQWYPQIIEKYIKERIEEWK